MNRKSCLLFGLPLLSFLFTVFLVPIPAFAATRTFTLSPMNQTIQLVPGEETTGSFKINNPNSTPFEYRLEITPFWVDNSYNVLYQSYNNYNLITNWLSYSESTGTVPASGSKTIDFTIRTPATAAPGGQYLAIRVSSRDGSTTETASGTRGAYSLAHILYAEVVGDGINRTATVSDFTLPFFVLSKSPNKTDQSAESKQKIQSGKVSVAATVKNTGTTLGVATLTLEAYPLFSSELKYSNLDDPATYKILPDTSRTVVLTWKESPSLGIFKVIHKVKYNDELISTKDGFIILFPLWLLIIILLIIISLIVLIIILKKRNKNVATPTVSSDAPVTIVQE